MTFATTDKLVSPISGRTPRIIQGGMGVAVSSYELAKAVAQTGEMGVVSGTALDVVLARRLQNGDKSGDIRRALAAFPVDKDLYELPPEEAAAIPQVPGSLTEVLDALEADHDYLLAGGVFTPDLIETWVEYKRKSEVDYVRLRPHPAEFELYYDI